MRSMSTNEHEIAIALVDPISAPQNCSTLCVPAVLEAAYMRKKSGKPICRKIVLQTARLRSHEDSGSEQPQFAALKTQLQVRHGAVHYLVLL